jgi:hypothetical protein
MGVDVCRYSGVLISVMGTVLLNSMLYSSCKLEIEKCKLYQGFRRCFYVNILCLSKLGKMIPSSLFGNAGHTVSSLAVVFTLAHSY